VLKITSAHSGAGRVILLLEGRLLGPWINELESAVVASGVPTEQIHLNLSGVHFADASGVRTLQQLCRQGAHLEGLSPFIRELLDSPEQHDPGGSISSELNDGVHSPNRGRTP
jgi:anti-anti-sigma regulatory factor